MTLRQINAALRETRAEMRARGVKRTSCFSGGLSAEVYRLNARMFELETLRDIARKQAAAAKEST